MEKQKKEAKTSDLKELKEKYSELEKKYSLPSFSAMNEDFQIERLAGLETEFLVKEVRKLMSEKFSNYLRFIEGILHPVNASIFIFTFIKTLSNEDKRALEEVFKKLTKAEIELIELDIKYSVQKEVDFIKNYFSIWNDSKEDLIAITSSVLSKWDDKVKSNGNGYFG